MTVRGTRLRATTDAGGRFRLDSVPAGEAVVLFTHAGLDSAGLSNLSQRVSIEAGRPSVVELTVPSHRTLRRLACRQDATFGRDSGLVLGAVTDAETGERIAGAAVVVSWVTARRAEDGRIDVRRPGVELVTDSTGTFYGCDVSTDLVVMVRAATPDGYRSGVTELLMGARGVARHDVTLSREDVPGARDTTGNRRGLATLVGVVRDEFGNPRPSAVVEVDDVPGVAYADSAGGFLLERLPSGSQMVMVRMVGFAAGRRQVDLRNRDTTRVAFQLRQVTVLDTLRITASSRIAQNELAELDRRMRVGVGYFLKAEQVRERFSMRTVLEGLPSLVIEGRSTFNFRMYTRVSGRNCPVALWVDGWRTDTQAIQSYRPDQIVAVEYYPRGQQAPLRFQRAGTDDPNCGVLLVWTRFIQ